MALFNRKQRTPEENMLQHQSSPQPTAEDYVQGRLQQMQAQKPKQTAFSTLEQPMNRKRVQEAFQTLLKYKEGKANLENRIVQNMEWYRLRHWDTMQHTPNQVLPTSAWLFNAIANKHADAMDNIPAPNVLPREQGDVGEAKLLSEIIPVVLDQNDFEGTYSDVVRYKLISGTGVYGVFWDASKLNGLGDITIEKVDILSLFTEPGITDIQRSKNVFHVELVDNDTLLGQFPQLTGKLSTPTLNTAKYIYDDTVDVNDKSVVVDWYYKSRNSQGKQILHYCKFCNDVVLYATENETQGQTDGMGNVISMPMSETGWYEHGDYPFILDPMFSIEGSPYGFGLLDVGKNAQEYIDRGNQAILQNMLSNARPRHFIRDDGSVNEAEYADMTKDFVHVTGNLGEDSIRPVNGKSLDGIYVEVINNKIEELKEVTGNRDISNGGTQGGVTAASSIAALIETGSKLSRDNLKSSYRAYRKMILMVIELIRQFYDMPRMFRIVGENGMAQFVSYSNAGIQPQSQGGVEFGVDMGIRKPLFDIEITAQKQSPYSKLSQNELALQFYNSGFFNPAMASQALACLDMMDFDRKDMIMQKIAQNAMAYQMAMAQAAMAAPAASADDSKEAKKSDALGGSSKEAKESPYTKKSREAVAASTSPQ